MTDDRTVTITHESSALLLRLAASPPFSAPSCK